LKIILSANTGWYLWNFRFGLVKELERKGHDVILLAPKDQFLLKFEALAFRTIDLPISGKGTKIVGELRTIFWYWYHFLRVRPDLYLGFTVKPVLYGGLVSRLFGTKWIATITGLGTVFIEQSSLTRFVQTFYRYVLRDASKVILQNPSDEQLFLERALVQGEKSVLVPGSGVNLLKFPFIASPLRRPEEGLRFLTLARLLRDKGIYELVAAAKIVKKKFPRTSFLLAGPANPEDRTAISINEVTEWNDLGFIEYLGPIDDVVPVIAEADCVILPSYREGLSRTLLEASSIGRPIITTAVPGCRDVVVDKVTGLLCEVRNSQDLADKIEQFLLSTLEDRAKMGQAGRDRAEREFSETLVLEEYLKVISEVSNE
jgi:glycosyltransferase involved in cell wall biosynthesis